MTIIITDLTVSDIRFPTSRSLEGSDAMNVAPDYSAAYVVLHTNAPGAMQGHGLTFTIGRGNEVVVAAVKSLARPAASDSASVCAAHFPVRLYLRVRIAGRPGAGICRPSA